MKSFCSRSVTLWILFVVMVVIAAPFAVAQSTGGRVRGTVTDASGGAVAGATVTLVNSATNITRTAITNSTGEYMFLEVPVGSYQIEVNQQGFKKFVRKDIVVDVNAVVSVDIPLQVGGTTETVEVTANAGMVETKDNAIAQVTDSQRIVEMPLNGRNLTQLLTLGGFGTSAPGGDLVGSKNIQGSAQSGTFSVAGGQANGVNYLLDGGDNNDAFSNVNLPIPFPDAVQEFNVQTNAVPAPCGA